MENEKNSLFRDKLVLLRDNIATVIKGKNRKIELVLIAFMAEGHVLIEDVPGVGKTMLARSVAQSVSGIFKRIQFTNDLLPTDILGNFIYEKDKGEFSFRKGPIFANILLADEINRGTPKVQSALLEAMEENTVSLDVSTFKLPSPFFVLATENPVEQSGTFSLPEAELDRFMIKIDIGYPSKESEEEILESVQIRHPIHDLKSVFESSSVEDLRNTVKRVKVGKEIRNYIVRLMTASREHSDVFLGGSPRASIALQRMAQGIAAFEQRAYVIPDDVKYAFVPVLRHRLKLTPQARINNLTVDNILKGILKDVKAP
ncbi:MoxR family ATPase [bacterium]|nr:MoxR family ATPase [bacterium]MCK5600179.1 MoxR family ATPase [bacterium]